jgi:hypothetical protein
MTTFADQVTTDIFTLRAGNVASNFKNHIVVTMDGSYNIPIACPYPGDGLDNYGTTQFKQGDVSAMRMAFKAIGPVGDGTRFDFTTSLNNVINASNGRAGAAYVFANNKYTQKSANYPKWGNNVGQGEANGSKGNYNEQIGWICIVDQY